LIALRSNNGMMKFGCCNEVWSCRWVSKLPGGKTHYSFYSPAQNSRVWVVLVNGYFSSKDTKVGLRFYDSEGQGYSRQLGNFLPTHILQSYRAFFSHQGTYDWSYEDKITSTANTPQVIFIVYWSLLFLNPIQSWKLTVLTPNTISQQS
jgi:hypothetical protein